MELHGLHSCIKRNKAAGQKNLKAETDKAQQSETKLKTQLRRRRGKSERKRRKSKQEAELTRKCGSWMNGGGSLQTAGRNGEESADGIERGGWGWG